jgi:lipoate-protein ligase A
MFCIIPESDDPFFNLALEEYLLKNSSDDYLILGINRPSVIIGKHQSPHREVNTRYQFENKIPVIRRISGGGTVYHDHGNLNFSFIRQTETGKQVNFKLYTKPVIDFLGTFGIEAIFEGKNDLKTDGLKISGNAEHVFRNRVLHHGTLLFSASLEVLRSTLRKDTSCYTTRAVESNPAHVTNLVTKLPHFRNTEEFRKGMMDYFLDYFPASRMYNLTAADIRNAQLLAGSKFGTWEWNYGYGPEYHFNNRFLLSGTIVKCSIQVRDGIIADFKTEGPENLSALTSKLNGCRHMPEEMLSLFRKENLVLSDEEIFNFF